MKVEYPMEVDPGGMGGAGIGTLDEDAEEYEDDESGWEGPSQEDWQAMVEYQKATVPVINQLGEYLSTPPQEGQEYQPEYQQQEEEAFDPYDEDSVQGFIQRNIQQGIEQALGPFQGLLGTIASREGESLAKGELDRIAGEVGEFDRDNAFLVANSLIEQGADPTQALQQAATYSRDFEAKVRADEREKYQTEMRNLAGAPRETGMGSSSATEGVGVPTGQDRYKIAVQRALGNGTMPVG
jgi:hypothetical protein